MSLQDKDRRLARKLAVLTAERGDAAVQEVPPALEKLLGNRPLSQRRAFVRTYLQYLRRELSRNTLVIEHVSELKAEDQNAVVTAFSKNRSTPLRVESQIRPDLIAGLRLKLGDNVFDASVAGRLQALAMNVQ